MEGVDAMNSKEYFISVCESNGVDWKKNFVLSYSNSGKRNSYYCTSDPYARTPDHKYVIKCFKDQNLYLAWNLSDKQKQSVFCLLRKDVEIIPGSIYNAQKGKEFRHGERDIVLCFDCTGIVDFLMLVKNAE